MPRYYLYWLTPEKNESLESYAMRMAKQIEGENPVLLGVSFGGVIAQEIAALMPVQALILISTITQPTELPPQLKLMRSIPLYQLGKGNWRIKTLPLWAPKFGIVEQEEQLFLKAIFQSFEDSYRMWATKRLLEWEGRTLTSPYLRLHGEKDKLFPYQYIQGAKPISEGRHFMISQHAHEIVEEILLFLDRVYPSVLRVNSNT